MYPSGGDECGRVGFTLGKFMANYHDIRMRARDKEKDRERERERGRERKD